MKIEETSLQGVLIIEPDIFQDSRGFFMETYQKDRYEKIGIEAVFVQSNLSNSSRGTLRGLHYQLYPGEQSKLVQVIKGEVFDVAVDIRKGSPTFGNWVSVLLSEENKRQIFIPRGFAHGFCVKSETAIFQYKCDNYYAPEHERGILWSDIDLNIDWPIQDPMLSDKDSEYLCLKDTTDENLPNLQD